MSVDVGEIHARATDFLHPGIGGVENVGTAATARTIPRALRVCRRVEERHAIAARPAARTRRPAVHPCRADGVHEPTVSTAIVRDYGVPSGVIVEMSRDVNGTH
jgi:hypothetical protein